jgi:hypothetical protein
MSSSPPTAAAGSQGSPGWVRGQPQLGQVCSVSYILLHLLSRTYISQGRVNCPLPAYWYPSKTCAFGQNGQEKGNVLGERRIAHWRLVPAKGPISASDWEVGKTQASLPKRSLLLAFMCSLPLYRSLKVSWKGPSRDVLCVRTTDPPKWPVGNKTF